MRGNVVTAAVNCGRERSRKAVAHCRTAAPAVCPSPGAEERHGTRSGVEAGGWTSRLCLLSLSGCRCGGKETCPDACRQRLDCAGRKGAGCSELGAPRRSPPETFSRQEKKKKKSSREEACHIFKQTDFKLSR